MPAFARRYHVSCSLCHDPIPLLTRFGETFAANGFELARAVRLDAGAHATCTARTTLPRSRWADYAR